MPPAYLWNRPFSHQNLVSIPGCRWKRLAARLQFSLLYWSPSAASNVATCRRAFGRTALVRYRVYTSPSKKEQPANGTKASRRTVFMESA